jgi:hypothetical protein
MTPGDFPWASPSRVRGPRRSRPGLRVRLRRVQGLTPKNTLREPLYLPCLIGQEFIQIKTAGHSEWQTVSAGEFSQGWGGKRAPTLDDLSFDSLSLTWDADWLTNPDTDPDEMRRELDRVLGSRKAFHLAIFLYPNGRGAEARGLYTLRSVERRLPRGEPDTRYYTLQFKEFREPNQRRRSSRKSERLPVRHLVQKGDTLRKLAKRYYGDGSLWRVIANVNGISNWGSEDDLTKIKRFEKDGARITVPDIESDAGGVGPEFPEDGIGIAPAVEA